MKLKYIINEANNNIINKNINSLPVASYLMSFPFTMATTNPNNIWMQEYDKKDLKIDRIKLNKQLNKKMKFYDSN